MLVVRPLVLEGRPIRSQRDGNSSLKEAKGKILIGLALEIRRQPYWLTWNQVHKKGGEILPEHKRNGTMFVFYKDHPIKEVPLLRYGSLYNIAQCKNIRLTDLPAYKAAERSEPAEDRDLVKLAIDFLKRSPDNPEIAFSDEANEAYLRWQ